MTEEPKTTVEPIFDTSTGGGMCYRLIDPSGESRVVFVLHQLRDDEETGKEVYVVDLESPVTEYVSIEKIDCENRGPRNRPRVYYKDREEVKEPLSFDDHETLVAYFEELAERAKIHHPEMNPDRKILRKYPPVPNVKNGGAGQKPSELNL